MGQHIKTLSQKQLLKEKAGPNKKDEKIMRDEKFRTFSF
jgi:hypothetical protein